MMSTMLPVGSRARLKALWFGCRGRLLHAASRAVPPLVHVWLRLLARTLRVEMFGQEELYARWERGEQAIVAFWHNRLLVMPLAAPERPICIMVSAHRDGEIAVRVLRRWSIEAVRGSTTRGGAPGLLRLVRAYLTGYSLAVAPDGPRGPRYVVKPGIIHLARLTGAPIFPVSWAASHAGRLRSWDRLIVPLPFARVALVAGEPLQVSRETSAERVTELCRILEGRLNELNRVAEARIAA